MIRVKLNSFLSAKMVKIKSKTYNLLQIKALWSDSQKLSLFILKYLVEMKNMLKSASKNIIPSQSRVMIFWKSQFACNYTTRKTSNPDARKQLLCTFLREPPETKVLILALFFPSVGFYKSDAGIFFAKVTGQNSS